MPFDIPDNWMWIRLGKLCKLISTGIEHYPNKKLYYSTGSIKGDIFTPEGEYEFDKRPSRANRIACLGDIIDAKMQGTLKVQIIDERLANSLLSTGFYVLRNYLINIEYLKYFICSNYYQSEKDSRCSGTTQKAITDIELETIYISLPPINEQNRIVNKIKSSESLLKHYEKIEFRLSTLEEEFPEKLKKSILQYAIEGKLVKQDPNDEPASVLLERIKAEKERLINEGKIKRDKNESYIFQGDDKKYYEKIGKNISSVNVPFLIPNTWKWIKARAILKNLQYGFNSSGLSKGKVKMLRITDIQNNSVNWDTLPYCSISEDAISDYQISTNDIFIARTGGTIGKSFQLREEKSNTVFAGYLIRFQFIEEKLSDYITLFLNSPLYWRQVSDKQAGTGQPNINGVSLGNLFIPIPTINEQTRIRSKINKIFEIITC